MATISKCLNYVSNNIFVLVYFPNNIHLFLSFLTISCIGETQVINIDVYKSLLKKSIEWQRAQEAIAKLKSSLREKSTKIRDLERKVRHYKKNWTSSSVNIRDLSWLNTLVFQPNQKFGIYRKQLLLKILLSA